SSIGGSVERISKSLQELNNVGVHASIDDFGKGYFALAHLYNFPIDCVKIDRSFIKMMEQGGNSLSVVRAISTIAQQLGLSVVAEGVETQEQLNLLKILGCEFAQGYYFSRPVLGENAWDLFVEEFDW
ncbi:MAG: EAL domain-containing protein, partial [Cyanobacteria bacterium J06649_11]